MAGQPRERASYRVLVAVETDATRYYGPKASRPRLLDVSGAEQMLAHLAADLRTLLPDIANCSLIAAGALFDQTQLLRPGFPVFSALESVVTDRTDSNFQARLVSVGATDGRMPDPALKPREDIPLGILLLLPVVVHGRAEAIERLGQAMEHRFLEKGQVSAHTASWLQSAFSISINHARFMTLTDLNALLRMQLEHYGFLPLWELLDAALGGRADRLAVTSTCGADYEWRGDAVHTRFETFDFWATSGLGKALPAQRQGLAGGYSDWTREFRQYAATLQAHGLSLTIVDPGSRNPLDGTFFVEHQSEPPDSSASIVTEHSFGELGTVAITVARASGVDHYYPLQPRGLNDIHAVLRESVPSGRTIAFPGTILYDERTRRLKPDTEVSRPRG
jgi:hypothetical protein